MSAKEFWDLLKKDLSRLPKELGDKILEQALKENYGKENEFDLEASLEENKQMVDFMEEPLRRYAERILREKVC